SWPDRTIDRAPRWCSVDLRDGNQALVEPMGAERKMRIYRGLVEMGYKEIEVGFPAASDTEYDFVREIIEGGQIPQDVTIQVLTQAREDLIVPTMKAIRGVSRAIVHVYNSTSTLQRRVVFGLDRAAIIDIAVQAVRRVKQLAAEMPETEVMLEYSPESFTGTELDFAVEICEAVLDEWGATPENPVILNLPSTVEMSSPNVYADQIEYFCRSLSQRERAVISVHPHNDRGCGVAAAELALMAGAERVEGTLFGNGERTGNVCVVTLALNMMSQGVDPGLDFCDIERVVELAEHCTRLPVHPRHPYAGELVFTAFSGSHQDAIRKGLAAQAKLDSQVWEVPYLPIDPADVGRSYEAVIRINSQSGKGGLAYVMERDHGYQLPRKLQVEFSRTIQRLANDSGAELSSKEIGEIFRREYLGVEKPFELTEFSWNRSSATSGTDDGCRVNAIVSREGEVHSLTGTGGGPVHAFVEALRREFAVELEVRDYSEHALGSGADARAVAYVELAAVSDSGVESCFGVATDESIVGAPIRALLAAFNRLFAEK
ncbi:MAG: 2-isopropylmalate synthase, partial [Deltaproteobacteria bacterium]|nr:2-isopropylmalate synthase [Deltaproteobacteria bacterium]